jgi:ABC-type transport system involved in multi-copper enzyme maturation permease subunit
MFGRIFAIALNTFREAVRNRVVYAIAVVAVGMMFFAIVIGEMSQHEEARVARDLSLAAVSFFGCVIAIVLGVMLLFSEVQRRTIHPIVAKPVARWEFVAGKYAGMSVTLLVLVAVFAVALAILLLIRDVPFDARVAKALILSGLEVLVVAAIAVFFSSFSTPFLSGAFTFAIFVVGRLTPEIRAALDGTESGFLRIILQGTLWVLPDLHLFSISGRQLEGQHVSVNADFVSWLYVGSTVGYGLVMIAALLTLAALIFQRRDFV